MTVYKMTLDIEFEALDEPAALKTATEIEEAVDKFTIGSAHLPPGGAWVISAVRSEVEQVA